jgi:preprotein translocase SecE subunit
MSDRRVLGFCWLLFTLFLAAVLADGVEFVLRVPLGETGLVKKTIFGGLALHKAVGAGLALAVALFAWNHKEAFGFCLETVQETRKVVWPDKQETQDHTVVVIVTSVIIALMLWGFDQVFKRLFSIILNLGT